MSIYSKKKKSQLLIYINAVFRIWSAKSSGFQELCNLHDPQTQYGHSVKRITWKAPILQRLVLETSPFQRQLYNKGKKHAISEGGPIDFFYFYWLYFRCTGFQYIIKYRRNYFVEVFHSTGEKKGERRGGDGVGSELVTLFERSLLGQAYSYFPFPATLFFEGGVQAKLVLSPDHLETSKMFWPYRPCQWCYRKLAGNRRKK